MKTRCNSLDECVVVSGFPLGNLNRRVVVTECVEWLGRPHWLYIGADIVGINGERAHCIADECLLPLRRHTGEAYVARMSGRRAHAMENAR